MFKVLLIGHFLGDFYFQCNAMQKKKDKWLWLILHAVIYTCTVTFCFSVYKHNWWIIICLLVGVFISHFCIDKLKGILEDHFHKKKIINKYDFVIFAIDQIIHILIVLSIACIFSNQSLNRFGVWIYDKTKYINIPNLVSIILTTLIIFKPASIFITKIFDSLPNPKAHDNQIVTVTQNLSSNSEKISNSGEQYEIDIKAGRLIGYLERFSILILFIMDLHTLIGLVLTAKSLARFKQLEDRNFAEKFLIGSLSSLVITILICWICKI